MPQGHMRFTTQASVNEWGEECVTILAPCPNAGGRIKRGCAARTHAVENGGPHELGVELSRRNARRETNDCYAVFTATSASGSTTPDPTRARAWKRTMPFAAPV